METFNTLEELWKYCLYCPVCKKSNREIEVNIGPDANYKILSYHEDNDQLVIYIEHRPKSSLSYRYNIEYIINMIDNSFSYSSKDLSYIHKYIYLYFNADCRAPCVSSASQTCDIDINDIVSNLC